MLTKSRLIIVLAASALLLTGCASAGTGSTPSGSGSGSGSSTSARPQTPDADPHQADVFSLAVGDCLNQAASDTVGEVPKVDCSAPHDFEVYGDFTVADGTYDEDAISQQADDGCVSRFADFIGLAYDDSTLVEVSFKPTEQSWAAGDRLISCTVGDDGVKSVGTLKGAMR